MAFVASAARFLVCTAHRTGGQCLSSLQGNAEARKEVRFSRAKALCRAQPTARRASPGKDSQDAVTDTPFAMTWSLSDEQRTDTAARMADGLLNLVFAVDKAGLVILPAFEAPIVPRGLVWFLQHSLVIGQNNRNAELRPVSLTRPKRLTQEPGDVVARAKAIEKRAYSAVLALSSTTTGSRPDVELRKIYAYEVAKLMQADLLEAATARAPSAATAGPSVSAHALLICRSIARSLWRC